ncbi:MAG TPA: glycoside hydrolase [Fibrobacteria bacterium]|nr:glycoside hydrolase [Fibrobacteria bacterium]
MKRLHRGMVAVQTGTNAASPHGDIHKNLSTDNSETASMKIRHPTPAAVAAIAVAFLPLGSARAVTVVVDPKVVHQTFEGWGTSLCWWAELAGKWSEANRERLIGAIVDPDTGLGYNCFRYNIGGGDQPGHTHLAEDRAVPGFKKTETGNYDWSADSYQRNILLGIAARAKNPIFEAFSNSPPWWMTISGCVSGNANGADNLKPTHFGKFAEYLVDVSKHYRDVHGITFRTIEPFNEPSAGWWKSNGGQEGCGFKSNQAKMVKELGRQLVAKGLYPTTTVSAGDETSLEQAVSQLKGYDDSAFLFLSQINAHSYSGWSSRPRLDSIARSRRKNLWQSESGPLNKGSDNSNIALWMSDVIIQDLRGMKPNAWIDWQLGDPSENWMSIRLDHSKQTFGYTARYYMHAAFSRFIRPGSRIVESSDANSVAAITPGGDLVVVLRNAASSAISYDVDLTRFPTIGTTARVHRFALPGSLARLADVPASGKRIQVSAPAQTITTIVVPGAMSPVSPAPPKAPETLRASVIGPNTLRIGSDAVDPIDVELFDAEGMRVFATRIRTHGAETDIPLGDASRGGGVFCVRMRQGNRIWNGLVAASR